MSGSLGTGFTQLRASPDQRRRSAGELAPGREDHRLRCITDRGGRHDARTHDASFDTTGGPS